MEVSPKDRTFIQGWNSRVKNSERTDDLVIPLGIKLLPGDGNYLKEQRIRCQADPKVKTSEMKETATKRIHFRLQNQFQGAKEPLDESE
jgi:hypothetical protein